MIQNIFLLDGLGGTGKSDFMKHITKKYINNPRGATIKKITTRPRRSEEETNKPTLDLQFVGPPTFVKHQRFGDLYTYDFGGYLYGFHKRDVERLLRDRVKHIFIIVKEKEIHRRIIQDFPQCRVIKVYIYSDKEEIKRRLQADGYTDEHVSFRLERISNSWFDYLEQSEIYNEIIINNSERGTFHKIIDSLIEKYEGYPPNVLCIDNLHQYEIVPPLLGFKVEMLHRVEKYNFHKNVFLMMKFRRNNKAIHQHIKTKLKAEGFNCVRADDPEWDITKNVYNPVAVLYCCKYGIALFDEAEDLNAISPNVAYELGMMHLQHKGCLILKHKELPDLPFDLIKDLHSQYSTSSEALELIDSWIEKVRFGLSEEIE